MLKENCQLIHFSFFQKKERAMLNEKRTVTPEKAVEILKKHGTVVTLEEAKIILNLMYRIGKLAVNQWVKM